MKKNEYFVKSLQSALGAHCLAEAITSMKPLTEKELREYEKKRKAYEARERRRRAKKITMTVGEFEDRLEEERDSVSCY